MAFTIKQFNDLRGILFLMLMTIPSIATTNIDCNGKAFQCVNSTHFMICVDLGGGISRTIDSFIIPCPGPTECHNTNRFECEFPAVTTQPPIIETSVITPDQTTIATIQDVKSTVQFVPELITTIPFEDLYNTVSTTTLSGSDLSNQNPTFITDTTTINVLNNANVSTSGSHADLENGNKTTDVLNSTNLTQDVVSKTNTFLAITDSAVVNITDNAIISTYTDGYTNSINKVTKYNLGDGIITTEGSKLPPDNATERVNLITENIIKTNINYISEKPLVTNNLNLSTTQVMFSETTEFPIITDSAVTNTTDNAIIYTQTDSYINTINKITTVNLDNEITTTEENKVPTLTITEIINLIGNNTSETNVIPFSEKSLVSGSHNITSSTKNQAEYITGSLRNDTQVNNNVAYITEIPLKQTTLANDKDLLRADTKKGIAVTVTNPLDNVIINTENTTMTLADVRNEHTDVVTEQATQSYATTETLVTSSIVPSDLSLPTESITLGKPNVSTKNKDLVTKNKQSFSVDRETIEQTLRLSPKTNIEMTTQVVATDYNLGNVAMITITDSDFVTGPSSELNNAVISSTVPTIDTTEITITHDSFYHIKPTGTISNSEVNLMTDIVNEYNNNNSTVHKITTDTQTITDSPTSTAGEKLLNTESTKTDFIQNEVVVQFLEPNLQTLSDTVSTNLVTTEKHLELNPTVIKSFISEGNINANSNSEARLLTDIVIDDNYNNNNVDKITTDTLPTTDSSTSTTDENLVSTGSINTIFLQNEVVVHSLEPKWNLKTFPDSLSTTRLVKAEENLEFNPTAIKSAISEGNINFVSIVDNQPSKSDSGLQQFELSNKQDSTNNLTNLNSKHSILSNIDLNAGKQVTYTETKITEPIVTEIVKSLDINDVNTTIELVKHESQPANETPKIETILTTETFNDVVSDSNIIFETSSYLEVHTPEKVTEGQVIIKSNAIDDKQLNSQNKNDWIINAGSSILPNEATVQYYDVTESYIQSDQITEKTKKIVSDFSLHKIISESRKLEPTIHEVPSIPHNEQTKTHLKEREKVNELQKTGPGTIEYSLTPVADSTLVNSESIIYENEQNKIIPLVVATTTSGNQLKIIPTTESILNDTVTDSAVSESSVLYESTVNYQLPKALLTKVIDIDNKHNSSEIVSKKLNKVDINEYETPTPPTAPLTETQTYLREIEFNKQQQEQTKTISDNPRNVANYDTISKLPVTESTRNIVDFNVLGRPVSPKSILQLTTSSVYEKTKNNILSSNVIDFMGSKKSIVVNNPDFIKIKNYNTEYYTGDLTPPPSITKSEKLDDTFQKTASLLETIQYDQNSKFAEELTTLQTPFVQITTASKFASKNYIAVNNKLQDKAQNNKNNVANIGENFYDTNNLLFKAATSNEANNQETIVPVLEKAVTKLSPSSTTEIKEIVPNKFQAATENTAYSQINHEVQPQQLSKSEINNKTDGVIGKTFYDVLIRPDIMSTRNLSTQSTYIDKHIIVKQEDLHTKESVSKEYNNSVVNEKKGNSVDIINQTFISYTETSGIIIPAEYGIGSEITNKSVEKSNSSTSTSIENLYNFVQFNKNNTHELKLVGKNIKQNFTDGIDTNLGGAETVQIRKKMEGNGIIGLVNTVSTQSSDILKIVPVTTDITSTPIIHKSNIVKDQALNSASVLKSNESFKPLQISGDTTVSKVSGTEKNNVVENTHSSIVSLKDDKKSPEASVKSLAERDVLTTSNKLSINQIESINSNSQNNHKYAVEVVNLVPFDLLSSAKSRGFEEKNKSPATEKPEKEETNTSGNEGNGKINMDSSFTTLSSESMTAATESVEGDNNGNNNIVQSNSKYETLTSKPPIEISTRPTRVDNLKNIQQLPFVSEVSTQSTVGSTSQKLSLEKNTPLPATTTAITNNFICKFNQRGRFADKHDCRKFYICHGVPQPLEGICPLYTVFSELRKQCTKNLSHCVRNNQFQCVSEGRFSDFLNDNIYYICAKNKLSTFIRFKLRCQNGYHLNKTSVRCILNTESSQSISSDISKSNSEQSAALKIEVKSKDSSKNKLECKDEGTFADPGNCRVYYVCKKTSKSGYLRKKKKCDSDEYFHKDKKKCVDAESYECK